MLATLVIGLREGLEAALIVGIIAAFLRRNGHSLVAMWIGVVTAVLLSIGVGVGLELISASLPQNQQEGMEAIIGAVAIVFVTGMIVWMNTHARAMRRELETSASAALKDGTALALAGMAFLAVLKEGFETSVFLLATFQSSTSTDAAVAGAVIGILIAVGIGIGLYQGGVKLNLGKFFKITGVFLVFVAAGLVVSMLRTAHEAGWVTIGQQKTLDLSWLAPNGSVQAALITGVLGIPADPRVIEVLGWLLYIIPVLAYCLWPVSKRPSGAQVPRLQLSIATALGVAAIVLAIAVPASAGAPLPQHASLADGGVATLATQPHGATLEIARGDARSLVRFDSTDRSHREHAGVAADRWRTTSTSVPAGRPARVSIDDLVALSGGRLPVGVNALSNPGPFTAAWSQRITRTVWSVDGGLLDARSRAATILTISGGGLPSPRTFSTTPNASDVWSVSRPAVRSAAASVSESTAAAAEALLWKLYLPIVLGAATLILACRAVRTRTRMHVAEPAAQPSATTAQHQRSTTYAIK